MTIKNKSSTPPIAIEHDADLPKKMAALEKKMNKAAENLDFENAKIYRDQLHQLRQLWLGS